MSKEEHSKVYPKNITVADVLELIEEKVREQNCSLAEAFRLFIMERIGEKN